MGRKLGFARLFFEFGQIELSDLPSLKEPVHRERDALGRNSGQEEQEFIQAGRSRWVGRKRDEGPIAEGVLHEPREHGPGSDLQEDPGAGLVHGLDLLDELYGPDELFGQKGDDILFLFRIDLSGRVRIDIDPGPGDLHLREKLSQLVLGAGDERRVESTGDGDLLRPDLLGLESLHGLFYACVRAGDHRLLRGIQVGEPHPFDAFDSLAHGIPVAHHGGHGAGLGMGGLHDEASPRLGDADQVLGVEDAGGIEGGVLPVAVAGGEVGLHPKGLQKVVEGHVRRSHCRLGYIGLRQVGLVGLGPLIFELRGRVDIGAQRFGEAILDGLVGHSEVRGHLRKIEKHLPEHVGVLGSLAGKQECDLAFTRHGRFGVIDPPGVADPAALFAQGLFGRRELIQKVVQRRGHDRDSL